MELQQDDIRKLGIVYPTLMRLFDDAEEVLVQTLCNRFVSGEHEKYIGDVAQLQYVRKLKRQISNAIEGPAEGEE